MCVCNVSGLELTLMKHDHSFVRRLSTEDDSIVTGGVQCLLPNFLSNRCVSLKYLSLSYIYSYLSTLLIWVIHIQKDKTFLVGHVLFTLLKDKDNKSIRIVIHFYFHSFCE